MKHKKMPIFVIIVVAVSLFAQGCATISRGSNQDVLITNPQGATASIRTVSCGPTPCVIRDVSRKADKITIQKDGISRQYTLDKSFNGGAVILGNILWLVPGVIIDEVSGAAHTIKPVDIKNWQALKTTAATAAKTNTTSK